MMDDDVKEGKVAAIRRFFKAGQAGDFAEAAEAFKDAYALCSAYEQEEGEEDKPPKRGGLAVIIGQAKPKSED